MLKSGNKNKNNNNITTIPNGKMPEIVVTKKVVELLETTNAVAAGTRSPHMHLQVAQLHFLPSLSPSSSQTLQWSP